MKDLQDYPYSTSFTTKEVTMLVYWRSPDGDLNKSRASVFELELVLTRGDEAETFISVKDETIVRKLFQWSPQKYMSFALDAFHHYAMLHWLRWMQVPFFRWTREYPELAEKLEAAEKALKDAEDAYYDWCREQQDKRIDMGA